MLQHFNNSNSYNNIAVNRCRLPMVQEAVVVVVVALKGLVFLVIKYVTILHSFTHFFLIQSSVHPFIGTLHFLISSTTPLVLILHAINTLCDRFTQVLNGIHIFRAHDQTELLAIINHLSTFLSQRPRVKLVVIDSIAFHFRQGE